MSAYLHWMFSKTAKVILDTNVLLLPGEGIDIFTEITKILDEKFEFCVIEGTFDELQKIMSGANNPNSAEKFNAKLGFIMAKQKRLKTISGSSKELVDDTIVRVSDKNTYVATLDKELLNRLKEKGIARIVARQRKYFQIIR